MLVDVIIFGVALSLAIVAQERFDLVVRHSEEGLVPYSCDRPYTVAAIKGQVRVYYRWDERWGAGRTLEVEGSARAKRGCA